MKLRIITEYPLQLAINMALNAVNQKQEQLLIYDVLKSSDSSQY